MNELFNYIKINLRYYKDGYEGVMEEIKEKEKKIWTIERKNAELEVEFKGSKDHVDDKELIS